MVSDLLAVAKGQRDPKAVVSTAPQRFGKGRMPVVVWNVCRHCNMTCPHCYIAAGTAPSRNDLSTEQARALIDDLVECGVRVLIFSGGEPLLRPDLLELISYATARGLSAHLSTNGTLIDEAVARSLKAAGIGYVGISIDGRPAFNDAWRGLAGGFDLAVLGLSAAREAGMSTGLRITLTRRNQDHVWDLLELAQSTGVGRFYVSHLLYSGRARAIMPDDVTPAESRELLHQLFAYADRNMDSELKIVTGGNDSDGVALLLWVAEHYGREAVTRVQALLEARGGNSAGEGILNIDNKGRVHPDQFWTSETLADLRKESFAVALEHPLRAELAGRVDKLSGRCGSCQFKSLCRGSHRERALAAHNDLWGPDPACVLTDAETLSQTLLGYQKGA